MLYFKNFFVCKYFKIDFPLFHKHFKHQDQIFSQTVPMITRSPISTILNGKK